MEENNIILIQEIIIEIKLNNQKIEQQQVEIQLFKENVCNQKVIILEE